MHARAQSSSTTNPPSMAFKRPLSSSIRHFPSALRTATCTQHRALHRLNAPTQPIPKPTPFVPDVPTFLTLIGRDLSQHAAKIPSWEALFSWNSEQLKQSGVEPARARRYLLWWRDRFRNGIKGIGGDLTEVKEGVGELRIVEVPSTRPQDQVATLSKDAGMRKVVVNTPASAPPAETEGGEEEDANAAAARTIAPPPRPQTVDGITPVAGVKIVHGRSIGGRGVEYVKARQGMARLKVQEGLWEQRRGHKVDGGERRKAEVRAKRRVQERKNAR